MWASVGLNNIYPLYRKNVKGIYKTSPPSPTWEMKGKTSPSLMGVTNKKGVFEMVFRKVYGRIYRGNVYYEGFEKIKKPPEAAQKQKKSYNGS